MPQQVLDMSWSDFRALMLGLSPDTSVFIPQLVEQEQRRAAILQAKARSKDDIRARFANRGHREGA